MKEVADEEDLLNLGVEAVDQVSCCRKPRCGDQDAFIVFDAVLAAFYIEVVDDVGVRDEGKVELVRRSRPAHLLSPELPGEQAAERSAGHRVELSAIEHVGSPSHA